MRVLHTLDALNRGAVETLVLDICRNAKRFGIDLTFVATGGGDLEKDFETSGVAYIRLDREMALDVNLAWRMRQIIKDRSIEIVQGYQPVQSLHLYLATIGLRSVKQVHAYCGFIDGEKNRKAAKFITPLVNANISCSKAEFPWLRRELGLNTSKNFYLVNSGVDPKRLEPSGVSVRKEYGFKDKDLILGMVANFRPDAAKDQLTACRALPEVFEKHKNAKFLFVGKVAEGAEDNFEECVKFCDESGIGERVFFIGGRADIPDILASLDLFVFSSLEESLPMAVIEAMLSRVPLVISDIEPLLEVTNDGKFAGVFKKRDPAALSSKILELLGDKDLRERYAQSAFNYAQEHFSIEAYFRSLKMLYLELLHKTDPATGDPEGEGSVRILKS